jgi:hypothetical protein
LGAVALRVLHRREFTSLRQSLVSHGRLNHCGTRRCRCFSGRLQHQHGGVGRRRTQMTTSALSRSSGQGLGGEQRGRLPSCESGRPAVFHEEVEQGCASCGGPRGR